MWLVAGLLAPRRLEAARWSWGRRWCDFCSWLVEVDSLFPASVSKVAEEVLLLAAWATQAFVRHCLVPLGLVGRDLQRLLLKRELRILLGHTYGLQCP